METINDRCISFDSYIKPQPKLSYTTAGYVVYLLIPTSNHNQNCRTLSRARVVYLLIPTSNHNKRSELALGESVVYLLIPTSNHNPTFTVSFLYKLYIF